MVVQAKRERLREMGAIRRDETEYARLAECVPQTPLAQRGERF